MSAAEVLQKRKQIRAEYRAMVTKQIGKVVGKLTAETTGVGDDRRVKLAQLRLTLKEKLEVLKQLDKEIVELLESEEDIVTEIDSSVQFIQRAYEALVSIDHWEVANKSKASSLLRGGLEGGAATTESTTPSRSNTRLLKHGITKWTSFWDSYKSAIHSTQTSRMPISSPNYKVCWKNPQGTRLAGWP